MSNAQIRDIEDQIRDLREIVRTTEAVYEIEKSPEKRTKLAIELGDLEYRIDRLQEKIEALQRID